MGLLLAVSVALIVYACLFPWTFTRNVGEINPVWFVLQAWKMAPGMQGWSDIALNIILYVPVGLFGALRLREYGWPVRMVAPVVFASVVSLTIEVLQVYDVSRVPSGIDWLTNTLGGLIGASLAVAAPRLFLAPMEWMEVRVRRAPAASILLGLWLAVALFPAIPHLSLYRLRQELQLFVSAPWPFVSVLSGCIAYAAVGVLLQNVSRRHALPALAASVLLVPAQLMLLGRHPMLAQLFAAICGLGVFTLVRKRSDVVRILAAAVGIALLLRGLAPFRFSMSAAAFGWIPLAATLNDNRAPAMLTVLDKCWWYGTAVWLLRRAGVSWWKGAGLLAVALAAIEVIQIWLPRRTPEITDPLLVLAMAAVLWKADATVRGIKTSNATQTAPGGHPASS